MSRAAREARLAVADAPAEGGVRVLDVGGVRVGVFRLGDAFHAVADRRPHRGAPVCAGRVGTPVLLEGGKVTTGREASILRCPWHKWEFEIATGRCVSDEKLRLRRYAVRVDGDQIVVSLDSPTP